MVRPCRTCRSRKKACNGAKPECGPCQKSGRQCGGYEPLVKGVFVNLDAGRIGTRMKSLIGDAIESAKQDETAEYGGQLQRQKMSSTPTAIHTLDLSPSEFQSHLRTLLTDFNAAYARSSSCWSEGVTALTLHSRALDMALISLATMRLSFTANRKECLTFSLSAYNTGLQSFRQLLADFTSESNPQLVVISLVFTLLEASQQKPTKIFDAGTSGHLSGALALMERQGPDAFRGGGFHVAFQKVREMSILYKLSTRESTFLARDEWMKTPWKDIPKTARDRLQDVAISMIEVYSLPAMNPQRIISECHRLLDLLTHWRQTWLAAEYPEFLDRPQRIEDNTTHQEHPLPHQNLFPNNDFAFLAAEYKAIALFLTHIFLAAHKNLIRLSDHNDVFSATSAENYIFTDLIDLENRIVALRIELETILLRPCFGSVLIDAPGITEGRCRSLFPIWVLRETDPDIRDGKQDGSQEVWWSGLYGRVVYGVG
ncbi:uncharacterized protein BDV14DRAFT_112163 [Aspergillus stella-maris]|uniref:uncharacterized protein n=1 Tax=Aspergillus stella-maris TaxID=1810926 RepID=UPI003CCD186A